MEKSTATLDVGYSWNKGKVRIINKMLNHETQVRTKDFLQPSVVGEAVQVYEDNLVSTDLTYREFDDNGEIARELYVGDMAVKYSQVKYATKKANKADTWTTKILIKTALAMMAPFQPVNLVSSLPYDFYFDQQKEFKRMLEDLNKEQVYEVRMGRKDYVRSKVSVLKTKLVPQGYAAAMDYLLDENGKIAKNRDKDAAKENLVIDIGFNNLGLIVIDAMDISTRSKSPEDMGITKAYELIQTTLQKKIGRAPTLYDLDKYVLKGEYDSMDITKLVDKAMEAYAGMVQMEIDNFNTRFNKYILNGGWAHKIKGYLTVPEDRLIVTGQMGNANGNLKIGARLWLNEE